MKCPNCNIDLTMIEVIDYERIDDDTMVELVLGKCDSCEHKYVWDRVYRLCEEKNLEVDE